MELIDSKKLEAVANFIGEAEVEGNCVCDDFNEALRNVKIESCLIRSKKLRR